MKYSDAGVDVNIGNSFVNKIKTTIRTTEQNIFPSGFCSVNDVSFLKELETPLLVTSTDGVGTKLKLAQRYNKLDTIGQDLVAMCANDIACSGAIPLYFLDYYATAKLEEQEAFKVIKSINSACEEIGCELVGGETAELPILFKEDTDFDIAGFIVGVVDKKDLFNKQIEVQDVLIAIPSSGPHSNGYSLINRILQDNEPDEHIIKQLLEPTHLYSPLIQFLKDRQVPIKQVAHITGGGIPDNLRRIIPENMMGMIFRNSFEMPDIFKWIMEKGGIEEQEMYNIFNCGIGMILVVDVLEENNILTAIKEYGIDGWIIGNVQRFMPRVNLGFWGK